MELTRREALATGGAAVASLAGPAVGAAGPHSLEAIARRGGRHFGSALGWGPPRADRGSFANPAYALILERECGVLVSENELKWQSIRPSPTTYDFTRAVQVAVKEYAPERIILLGPGDTLGGAIAQALIAIHWRGLTSKQDFQDAQATDPILLSMGREDQRTLAAAP